MRTKTAIILAGVVAVLARGETRTVALEPGKMKLRNVKAEQVNWKGRSAVRVTDAASQNLGDGDRLALLPSVEFQDGAIEIELAGDVGPSAVEGARGFVGVAFRVATDSSKFECFYLRPTNGRADDQVRRNHSAQYISFPEFPWQRLRKEQPEKYESYVDLAPGEWTKVKIVARGDKSQLYVHGAAQPTLIVNDLKHGASKGAIALWVGPGTIAHFANVTLTPQ